MRKPDEIAILCSDLHLSLTAPACRADDNWLEIQAHYLHQLEEVTDKLDIPIICAGDIFDRWNAPPELIHFALKELPDDMICVPGQHDLPNHNLDEMHRSGYGVLVAAGKIRDISEGSTGNLGGFIAYGFGWGQKILPVEKGNPNLIHLAVIHKYIWTKGNSYPGAPEESHCKAFARQLAGYDAAVFGDNHAAFTTKINGCRVINTGTFIRRKSDEIGYRPRVGILMSDGTIKEHFLDTSRDKFHADTKPREEVPINMQEFIQGLEELGEHGLNFREAVENHLRTADISPMTKQIILKALDA